MQCAELVSYLSDYIDNNLSEELTREAQEHLATCQNCHIVLDSTQRTILLPSGLSCSIGSAGSEPGFPPGGTSRFLTSWPKPWQAAQPNRTANSR